MNENKFVDIIMDGVYYGNVREEVKHNYFLDCLTTLYLNPQKVEYNMTDNPYKISVKDTHTITNPHLEVKLFNKELQQKLGLLIYDDDNNLVLPYKTDFSAAFDLFAVVENDVVILPGEVVNIPTGLSLQAIGYPFKLGLRLYIRSGVSSFIHLTNSVGLVDPDYQGELILKVKNHNNYNGDRYVISPGERIAQAEFFQAFIVKTAKEVTDFSIETTRKDGGFGHTGKF